MAVDDVIVRAGPVAVPLDYKVPNGTEIIPRSISARLNGGAAGGSYVPALLVIAPSGAVTAYCARRVTIAAGASVLVSWFPGVAEADDASSSASSAGGVSSVTSPQGTLSVNNPTGPAVNVDLPLTGAAAGSYGDASHSVALTVDAEGRITSAAQVAIAGGSGTIGFEIGYDQITAFVTIASTTEATGTTIITCGAHTFDGAPVLATFFAPAIQLGGQVQDVVTVSLFEGATQIGRLCQIESSGGAQSLNPGIGMLRFTPTAGVHTYKVTAIANALTATPGVVAGAGGTGAYDPAFIRFTKV